MTVRGKTAAASPGPEHHVLLIEEVRKCLGIGPDALNALPQAISAGSPQTSKIILVGHDMHDDFDNMKKQGIELKGRLPYSGCIDTHAIIEDTGKDMSRGLSALMSRYGFAALHQSDPTHNAGKFVFDGAHNAGNDAVANVMVAVAQALDKAVTTTQKRYSGSDDDLDEEWVYKPLLGLDRDVILLAYDTEKVESRYKPHILNRTTEHGFAWLRFSEIINIPPGNEYGTNWHTKIQATHFINKNWKDYENKKFLCGNSKGFWPQYGKSQLYDPKDGPAPFHALFAKIARENIVKDATASFGKLSLDLKGPAYFPALTSSPLPGTGRSRDQPVRDGTSIKEDHVSVTTATGTTGDSTRQTNPWNRRTHAVKVRRGHSSTITSTATSSGGTTSPASEEESPKTRATSRASSATSTGIAAAAPVKPSWAQIARSGKDTTGPSSKGKG